MKLVRYRDSEENEAYARQTRDGLLLKIDGDIFGDFQVTNRPVEPVQTLAPIKPRAILAVGLNYMGHAREMGSALPKYPMIFMKLPGIVQNPGGPILLPRGLRSDKVDYEGELAVVIGKTCKNVSRDEALDHVLGFTCANDVSARDWQKEWGGGQFCRGKSFDTFCPLGPALVTTDSLPDPHNLVIRSLVNGEIRQESATSDLIFDIPALIEFLSGSTTLEPGTLILTGTPSGVGAGRKPPVFLQAGDEVSIEIEGIGKLTNPVEEEKV